MLRIRAAADGTAPEWAGPRRARVREVAPVAPPRPAQRPAEDIIYVPASEVGRVIGKAGYVVQRVERDHGVRVHVAKSGDPDVEVRIVAADKDRREAAIATVLSIVERTGGVEAADRDPPAEERRVRSSPGDPMDLTAD